MLAASFGLVLLILGVGSINNPCVGQLGRLSCHDSLCTGLPLIMKGSDSSGPLILGLTE